MNGYLLLVVTELLVSLGIHEVVELRRIRQFNLDDPVGEGILIDELWLIFQGFIHLYDLAADRTVEVTGSFDALDSTKLLTGFNLIIDIRHININHITECVLSVIGYSDSSYITIDFHILMALCIVEALNNFSHNTLFFVRPLFRRAKSLLGNGPDCCFIFCC